MRPQFRLQLCASLAVLLAGCATFGTNVEGSFQCRAPEGSCAPSHIIDARAAGEIRQAENPVNAVYPPRMVAPGDQARTAERTLKIVFPARVDEAGTLHDEAVAWAVIENPRWAARAAKQLSADRQGMPTCEACGFAHPDFGMFDAHHPNPLATGQRQTLAEHLIVLCPTCHRRAHRKDRLVPFTLAELRDWIKIGRS